MINQYVEIHVLFILRFTTNKARTLLYTFLLSYTYYLLIIHMCIHSNVIKVFEDFEVCT